MAKSKNKRTSKYVKEKPQPLDSDDEGNFKGMPEPDKFSSEYYNDEVDDFHNDRDKISFDDGTHLGPADSSADEEEVLGVYSSDESDDEEIAEYKHRLDALKRFKRKDDMASDIEEDDDGLPDSKAWGKSRSKYYGGDLDDEEAALGSDSDEDDAALEEKEALAIQKRLLEQIDDDDFGLGMLKAPSTAAEVKDTPKEEEKIHRDLSKLTKREKLELLKKESPEFLTLIEDYKTLMAEVEEKWLPLVDQVRKGNIPSKKGCEYIETKMKLCLNYCLNISFYVTLKAKAAQVHSHPVIERIVQYRNLLKELEPVDEQLSSTVADILERIKNGQPISEVQVEVTRADAMKKRARERKEKQVARQRKKAGETSLTEKLAGLEGQEKESAANDDIEEKPMQKISAGKRGRNRDSGRYETKDEVEALEYYEMMKAGRKKPKIDDENGADDDVEYQKELLESGHIDNQAEDEDADQQLKRGITYQIEKNKGLTPRRKKELRNPRVKNRMKYRKAKIRRKGQIREYRPELEKYSGEASGIRAGIKRSVKLK